MKLTILDKSTVKYNGKYLTAFQTYLDVDDTTANQLIASGDAKEADDKIAAVSVGSETDVPKTKPFDPEENGGYVGEAVIDPAKKEKLKAEGKLNDDTPVIGKDKTDTTDKTPDTQTQTEVLGEDGKPLSEEQVRAKEQAALAGQPSDDTKVPTVAEANASGTEVPKAQ